MKLLIKFLGISVIVAAAIAYDRGRLRRAGRLDAARSAAPAEDPDGAPVVRAVTDAEIVGISDVDPVPLASVGPEAVDPDAVEEAHRSIPDQRERLPVPGKNLP